LFFIKGLLSGALIGIINFSLLYFFRKKINLQKLKPVYLILYINKLIFIGLLIFFFIKFRIGNIIGLITGFTVVLIIFYIGVMFDVRSAGSDKV
jgi:hypothetical protein